MTPAELLLAAADHLEQKGWCRETFCNSNGECCVIGAIQFAASGRANRLAKTKKVIAALRKLADAIGLGSVPSLGDIKAWNDSLSRTKEEVIAALRQAAQS